MFAVTITLTVIIIITSLVSLITPSWTVKTNLPSTPGTSPVPTPIQSIFEKAMEIWEDDNILETAQDLEDFEQTVHNLGSLLKALLVEQKLQTTLDSEQMINDGVQLAKNLPCKTKNNGYRDGLITL